MQGRRRNPRNLCADLLKVRWRDSDGAAHREYATLEDISEGGLCLRLEPHIAPGATLTIQYPGGKYEGRVIYCLPEHQSYIVGVEFLPGYRWSRREYKPPHLLQFRLRLVEEPPQRRQRSVRAERKAVRRAR